MTQRPHSSIRGIDNDTYFLGWDVGGWNCDKNGKSRDAIVILNQNVEIVGKPWRGNLRVPIKDMIGSQATKGIHTVAKFAPRRPSRGVWADCIGLTAIEGYPSACKYSATIMALWSRFRPLGHEDFDDAPVFMRLTAM